MLAVMVVLGHSPELIDGDRHREWLTLIFGTISLGELAVDAFFLLSGYLIVQSWNAQPSVLHFLLKRVARIYPGFIVATLLCGFIVGPLASTPADYFRSFDLLKFFQQMLLLNVPAIPPVFAGTFYPLVNGSLWTISKEFTCYMGVLILGASGMFRSRYAWLAVAAACFATFILMKIFKRPVGDLRLFIFFLNGACFYQFRAQIRFRPVFFLVAVALVLIGMFSWRGAEMVLATAGAYLLFYLGNIQSAFLFRFNRLPDVSYGIYLYAWPVQKMLLWHEPGLSSMALFGLAAFVSTVAGVCSWYLVEKPVLRYRERNFKMRGKARLVAGFRSEPGG